MNLTRKKRDGLYRKQLQDGLCGHPSERTDYVDIVSRELYKDFGATGPDWRSSNWIFSQLGRNQEEPHISKLTNSSKETGDTDSSEHFDARQTAVYGSATVRKVRI